MLQAGADDKTVDDMFNSFSKLKEILNNNSSEDRPGTRVRQVELNRQQMSDTLQFVVIVREKSLTGDERQTKESSD